MDKLITFFKAIVYYATLPFSIWFWEKPKAGQDVSSTKKEDNNSIERTR
jgi:hypothetical protein